MSRNCCPFAKIPGMGKPRHLLPDTGVPAKGFGKKRGRKEDDLHQRTVACGFHRLCAFIIMAIFEQVMTTLKTKIYFFVNKFVTRDGLCHKYPEKKPKNRHFAS